MSSGTTHAGIEESNSKSSVFFLFCALIATFVVLFLLYRWTIIFEDSDPHVPLQHISSQKIKEWQGNPAKVDVGLAIENFRTFDMSQDDFVFDGIVSFLFDPSVISLHTIGQFSFERGEILYRSNPSTRFIGGKLFVRYDIRLKFSSYLNYEEFPFDDHHLSIVLTYKNISPAELMLEANNSDFIVKADMSVIGWHKMGSNVETGYLETKLNEFEEQKVIRYPVALFTINYGRQNSLRNSIIIILPMLLLFFTALFATTLNPRHYSENIRVGVPIQTVVGLVAYRFVMESMSPKVGYFMYSDYCFLFFLVILFCIAFVNSLKLSQFAQALVIIFNFIVIGFFVYLLWI